MTLAVQTIIYIIINREGSENGHQCFLRNKLLNKQSVNRWFGSEAAHEPSV